MVNKVLEEAAEKHLNYALFKLSYDDEDGIEQYILDAFEAGAAFERERMMKDAVVANIRSSFGLTEMSVLDEFIHFPFNKNGDKVKLIIVKEDEQ